MTRASRFRGYFSRPAVLFALVITIGACLPSTLSGQWTSGNAGSIYYNLGNVGIGTTSPGPIGDGGTPTILQIHGSGASPFGLLQLTTTATGAGSATGALTFGTTGATSALRTGEIVSYLTAPSPTYATGNLTFYTANGAAGLTEKMRITETGFVGIGTTSPAYKLSVNGTILAKEVIVSTSWSDYVFEPTYRLTPLSQVAVYIRENHHLPDMPSAAEVQEKGIGLGEIQSKLLAKVEELTLHAIRLEEQNHALQERIARLEKMPSNPK